MKKMMCIAVIITAFMLLMPLAVLSEGEIEPAKTVATNATASEKIEKTIVFNVFDTETEKITEIPAEEYIFGVVAAEMPALYDTEALKAQAVAAYTYACYKKNSNSQNDYDITTDFTIDQSFKTETKAKEDWGEKAEEYTNKIKNAVKAVKGEMLCYDNQPILAVYHAVSCGQTYSAKDVWGKEIDYLKSVASQGDKLANNYTSVLEFTEEQIKEKISQLAKNKKDNAPLLSNISAKNNGIVENIELYGEKITGIQLREALGLPSSNFKFEKQDSKYIFTCLGYGHGVGMSQKGADYMAKQGYTYKQILSHYYRGTKISKS